MSFSDTSITYKVFGCIAVIGVLLLYLLGSLLGGISQDTDNQSRFQVMSAANENLVQQLLECENYLRLPAGAQDETEQLETMQKSKGWLDDERKILENSIGLWQKSLGLCEEQTETLKEENGQGSSNRLEVIRQYTASNKKLEEAIRDINGTKEEARQLLKQQIRVLRLENMELAKQLQQTRKGSRSRRTGDAGDNVNTTRGAFLRALVGKNAPEAEQQQQKFMPFHLLDSAKDLRKPLDNELRSDGVVSDNEHDVRG